MIVEEVNKNAAINVTSESKGLSVIQNSDCAAAIWQRQLQPELQSWINKLNSEFLPIGRVILHKRAISDTLYQLCEIAKTPHTPERDLLIEDITVLSHLFAEIMHVDYLKLRLDAVTNNACRKFHIDAVSARLVCTYRGKGTQYGVSVNEAEPDSIFTAPTGAPIILRGTLWPAISNGMPKSHLLHRSPPIEGSGETRLLLVLDPVNEMENKAGKELLH